MKNRAERERVRRKKNLDDECLDKSHSVTTRFWPSWSRVERKGTLFCRSTSFLFCNSWIHALMWGSRGKVWSWWSSSPVVCCTSTSQLWFAFFHLQRWPSRMTRQHTHARTHAPPTLPASSLGSPSLQSLKLVKAAGLKWKSCKMSRASRPLIKVLVTACWAFLSPNSTNVSTSLEFINGWGEEEPALFGQCVRQSEGESGRERQLTQSLK